MRQCSAAPFPPSTSSEPTRNSTSDATPILPISCSDTDNLDAFDDKFDRTSTTTDNRFGYSSLRDSFRAILLPLTIGNGRFQVNTVTPRRRWYEREKGHTTVVIVPGLHFQRLTVTGRPKSCRAVRNGLMASWAADRLYSDMNISSSAGSTSATLSPASSCSMRARCSAG